MRQLLFLLLLCLVFFWGGGGGVHRLFGRLQNVVNSVIRIVDTFCGNCSECFKEIFFGLNISEIQHVT